MNKRGTTIKVMIVDDHPAVRKGIAALIETEPDLQVVGQTGDGSEALNLFRRVKPDVVLMDLRLPGLTGEAFPPLGPGSGRPGSGGQCQRQQSPAKRLAVCPWVRSSCHGLQSPYIFR